MVAPSTSANFHGIRRIVARSSGSLGAPLTLLLLSHDGRAIELTIFLGDQHYADRLVEEITNVWQGMANPVPRVACPQERAAYAAAAMHYFANGSTKR